MIGDVTLDDIIRLNEDYGGVWAIKHSERLIHLVEQLGAGMTYDKDIINVAAHMHDWGGYARWLVPGVEHYDRSREVADQFLREHNCPDDVREHILECIVYHHGGPVDRSIESKLFTDADALDLLGIVGTVKVFSMCPRDLGMGFDRAKSYRDMSMKALTFDSSKALAQIRVAETDQLLSKFEEESFGMF